jgi:chromosome segregation ATPase
MYSSIPVGTLLAAADPLTDLDVTVVAFAQWVSEMKTKQNSAHHHMQAQMSVIRNSITSNSTELVDFKRNYAAIQQQMQHEMYEIRESLGTVFTEITAAVRSNATADQETRSRIQSLNEQAVRNETAFAQLADAADQSQTKVRNVVQEMQVSSERMREELASLTKFNENMEISISERYNRIAMDMDAVGNDLHVQLERRKDHLRKMLNDVMLVGESLHNLVADVGDQKKGEFEAQNKLQSNLYVLDQILGPEARGRHLVSPVQMQAPRALTPLRQQLDGLVPAGAATFPANVLPVQSVYIR